MNTRNKIILTMLVTSGIVAAAGAFYYNQINMRSSAQSYIDMPVTVFPDEFQEIVPIVSYDKKNSDKILSGIYTPRQNELYPSFDHTQGHITQRTADQFQGFFGNSNLTSIANKRAQ